ncbi:SUMF1/EgtB/PvdO family nonheme iron enzyme [Capnocytophaga sp.]|uniref:formylglycine-generating enzyme family protein n=1 Tax=Capnocytophaga sp. TaxID=44737 RepID=UPI0026DB1FA2|nr:SUMF1/EgtB/PvdO family nonheme iron enzyme [Capnocytophaga sp.]MDO5104443.1 SUMF1/EgtB/PvdO family nonheme iron enzyme [Capnocytophaga sp.]
MKHFVFFVFLTIFTIKIEAQSLGNYPEKDKISVKGGTFLMGSKKNEGEANERPQHQVTIADFKISKYEITNIQYAEFLNTNGNQFKNGVPYLELKEGWCQIEEKNGKFFVKKGYEQHPVVLVSWHGAKAYAEWVRGKLPSEEQWEYAARGGKKTQNHTYAGSNSVNEVAWYRQNTDELQPVGKKKPNELGIYDMSGNVAEWCNDFFISYDYKLGNTSSPQMESSFVSRLFWAVISKTPGNKEYETNRVTRGGHYNQHLSSLRIARRYNCTELGQIFIGFRVVFD